MTLCGGPQCLTLGVSVWAVNGRSLRPRDPGGDVTSPPYVSTLPVFPDLPGPHGHLSQYHYGRLFWMFWRSVSLESLPQIPSWSSFLHLWLSDFFFFVRKLFGQHWQGGFLFPRPAEFFLVRCGVGRCVRAHESHEVLRNLSDTETVRHPSAESPPSVCLGPEGVSPPQTPSWVGLTLPPAGHLCKARSLVHTADGGFQGLG